MKWKEKHLLGRKQILDGGQPIHRNMKQCEGKNCYGKNQAKQVARAVMRTRNRKVREYECGRCHMWHITSQIGGSKDLDYEPRRTRV